MHDRESANLISAGVPTEGEPRAMMRIAILATPGLLVDALVKTLQLEKDIEAVGASRLNDERMRQVIETDLDIIVIDADWAPVDTSEVLRLIRARKTGTRIVVLVGDPGTGRLEQARRMHTSGFVSKEESVERLSAELRRVAAGKTVCSPAVEKLMDYDRTKQSFRLRIDSPLINLTDRQLDICRHLARGESVKEVARKLYLSPKAIESHKYRIMKRLGIRDRVHLARFAIREGLVDP